MEEQRMEQRTGVDLSFTAGMLYCLMVRALDEGASMREIAERVLMTPEQVESLLGTWRER